MIKRKTGRSSPIKVYCITLLGLALTLLAGYPALRAQAPAAGQQNSFDYMQEKDSGISELTDPAEQINLEDIEVINDPQEGARFVYRHRWKDWIERALYLALANIAILGLLASLPRNNEHMLIISYVVAGVSFQLSLWILLCGVLILQLKASAGLYALPLAGALCAATYYLLMKVKKADIDLTALKDSFKLQQGGADGADPRLASLDGSPGDWTKNDFLD